MLRLRRLASGVISNELIIMVYTGGLGHPGFSIFVYTLLKPMQSNVTPKTSNRVNRADKFLESLVDRKVLTPAGLQWLRIALDPFHDLVTDPCTYPDGRNTISVPETVTQEIVVKKPASLAAGNWTAHIFTLPILFNGLIDPTGIVTIAPGTQMNGWLPVVAPTAAAYNVGTVNVHAALDGTALGIFSLTNTTYVGSSVFPASFFTGGRLVSLGFEVHNTTAKLNLQGTCCHYRIPMYDTTETLNACSIAGAQYNTSLTAHELPQFPGSPSTATQLLGTQKWEAAHGNYTTIPQNSIINPPRCPASEGMYFYDPTANRYLSQCVVNPTFVVGAGAYGYQDQIFTTTGICGSFYYGLSDSTTLTITSKMTVERFASLQVAAEAELVRLSKACPPRDQVALDIYSAAIAGLPVSVVVAENSFGDWFIDVAKQVISSAAPLIGMIPHPAAKAIAAAAPLALPVIDAFARSPPPKKNPVTNQPRSSAPREVVTFDMNEQPPRPRKRQPPITRQGRNKNRVRRTATTTA
jgi:hypothetical protein